MCPGFPGQVLELEVVVCAVVPFPGVGFDIGGGQYLELGFIELAVFINLNEFVERFLAVLVLDLDVQVVEPYHLVYICL